MSGRRRIIIGGIAQGGARGKALGDALFKELNQSEKGSTYQNEDIKKK